MTNKNVTFQNSVVVTDIALIRNLNGVPRDMAVVASAEVHGSFWFDITDTSTVDDGRTCIVATDGGRWKLVVLDADAVEYQPGSASAYRDGSVGAALAGLEQETASLNAAVFSSGGLEGTVQAIQSELDSSGGLRDSVNYLLEFVMQLASSIGASLVGFVSAGTGATARTVQNKLREQISVMDFGAKGDYNGTTGTDDTAAIQACIDWVQANTNTSTYGSYSPAAGTSVVYFPQGSYKVTSPLIVTTKVCIAGEGQTEFSYGSRLTQVTANTDLFQIAASAGSTSFSVENMVLRSNVIGAGTGHLVNMVRSGGGTVNSQRYVNCTFSQPQAMALMLAGDDIVIKNCLFDVSQQSGNCVQLGTSTMYCTDVRIEGCDFFNPTNSCIRIINVVGLTVNGNILSQPNGTTKTPYFIDGQVTTPTAAQDIAVCNNTVRGPRTFIGITGVVNLTVCGNTVAEGGIGTGETFHMLQFGGSEVNIAITGNTFRGSYGAAANFYNDFNASAVTGVIASNSFQNDGGAADALSCTKFTGRLLSNFYAGFVNRQMGEKRATTGAPINPGTIAAGSTFGYALTVTSATFGDAVSVGTISNAWVAQTGIDVRAFINNTDTVRVEYRNVTAGAITVAAHDLTCEVTR